MKALYIRTAKTGSSSIVRWGQNYFSYTHNKETLDSENNKTKLENHFKQNHFLFYSIRNPYDRAISCWQQCIASGWEEKDFTFDKFLNLDFDKIDNEHMLTHTQPLTEYLGTWIDKVDFVVRLENFESCLKRLAEHLEMPFKKVVHEYSGNYNKKKYANKYLNTLNKKKIEKKYLADFEYFGY